MPYQTHGDNGSYRCWLGLDVLVEKLVANKSTMTPNFFSSFWTGTWEVPSFVFFFPRSLPFHHRTKRHHSSLLLDPLCQTPPCPNFPDLGGQNGPPSLCWSVLVTDFFRPWARNCLSLSPFFILSISFLAFLPTGFRKKNHFFTVPLPATVFLVLPWQVGKR